MYTGLQYQHCFTNLNAWLGMGCLLL